MTKLSLRPHLPVIIGENPSSLATDSLGAYGPDFPMSGRPAGTLLRALNDLSRDLGLPNEIDELPEYDEQPSWRRTYFPLLEHFDMENLCDGKKFSTRDAVGRVDELMRIEPYDRIAVLCGRKVTWAFLTHARESTGAKVVSSIDWFTWFATGRWRCISIPHPSGLNRKWNDPVIRRKSALAIREALKVSAIVKGFPSENRRFIESNRLLRPRSILVEHEKLETR